MPIRTSPNRNPVEQQPTRRTTRTRERSPRRETNAAPSGTPTGISKPLSNETKRILIPILLALAALLSGLSLFSAAGVVGIFIDNFLRLIFGVARYVVPVLLVVWAVIYEREEQMERKPHHIIGFTLFLLSINALAHIFVPVDDMVSIAMQGYNGGLVGLILAYPLMRYTSIYAAVPVLCIFTLLSIMLIANVTLSQIGRAIGGFFGAIWNWFASSLMFTRTAVATTATDEPLPEMSQHRIPSAAAPANHAAEEEVSEVEEAVEEEEEIPEPAAAGAPIKGVQEMLPVPAKRRAVFKPLPAFDLLQANKSKPGAGDTKSNGQIIVDTLKQFGIGCELAEVRTGPSVTQYAIHPDRGVKISRITALSNDLALALSAHPIRIEAPIPGKPYVGIEVPNERVALVTLRELLEAEEFQRRSSNMQMSLGKDVSGKVWLADLTRMPHLLVAGATGSGKTVCLNTLLLSLLYQNTDETLRMIMVDPKRVELTLYNGLPHLLTPVITDTQRAVNALKWTISEMERRYDLLSKVGSRDILSYNKKMPQEKLPYIVFVIDELADLMMQSGAEMEGGIVRLAQMSRAVGIHLIVATQRPSVDVITGLMKANIPARIAFSVASVTDSRTILDSGGAEKLLGRGDMLLQTADMSRPKRIQGAFVSEEEMKKVVDYWKSDTAPEYNPLVVEKPSAGSSTVFGDKGEEHDSLYDEAKEIVIESGKASTSLLQRRLKLGYARAARIIDELEAAGVVGPGDGAKPREILALKSADATMLEVNSGMLDVMDAEEVPAGDESEFDADVAPWDVEEVSEEDLEKEHDE
ncbi:MAG: DNA translocase FtsK 4TM domain-containing protein [Candidatus Magasanikbacteria bacterium]|nr:DNA translocase FtsK 4TM domain-containing protein [Candidatus Magasanikbacteria bacterium]